MTLGTTRSFMSPAAAITHFHIREGDTFADFGAGGGDYIAELSKSVGTSGSVYACEIQKGLIERITTLVHHQKLGNVHPIWCDLEAPHGTKLRDGFLDAGMLLNTLFQIEDKNTALDEIARVIRTGGKFFVIDWLDSFGGIGPHPSHVVNEDIAKALVAKHGFVFERSFPVADHHYGLAFRRA